MFEKLNCLQVLVFPVFVWYPLPCISSVVQVQHGGYSVHTESVNVVFLDPEQRVGDQEILHFILAVIKNFCPPVRMLAFSGVCILICGGSVKVSQPMGVLWEMGWHPVKDHTDLILMHVIYKILEIFRRSVPGRRGIIPCYLVSPGTVIGMFRYAHQLHMGVPHLFDIVCQRMSQLPVVIESVLIPVIDRMFLPGTRMQLIDRHGILLLIEFQAFFHPDGITPFEFGNVIYTGSCTGAVLRIVGIRVRLEEQLALVCGNAEFVQVTLPHFWYEELVNTHIIVTFHHIFVGIPFVEISHNRYRFGVRCPDGEIYAVFAPLCCGMCTHQLIDFIMCSFSE